MPAGTLSIRSGGERGRLSQVMVATSGGGPTHDGLLASPPISFVFYNEGTLCDEIKRLLMHHKVLIYLDLLVRGRFSVGAENRGSNRSETRFFLCR
jgi:hypothetical protein